MLRTLTLSSLDLDSPDRLPTPTHFAMPSPISTASASPVLDDASARGGSPLPMAAPVAIPAGARIVRQNAGVRRSQVRMHADNMMRLLLNIKTARRSNDIAERLSCMDHAKFIVDYAIDENPEADTTDLKDLYDLLTDVEHDIATYQSGELTRNRLFCNNANTLAEARMLYSDIRRRTVLTQ